jgi:hypothetical protein
LSKNQYTVGIKNADFDADFESAEKLATNIMRKSYQQKWQRDGVFDSYCYVQKFSAYKFLGW